MAQPGDTTATKKHPAEKMSLNKNPKKRKILKPNVAGPIIAGTKKKYYITNIILALTACPLVVAGFLKKPGRNESGFGHPMHLAFEDDPESWSQAWHVLAWLVRQDLDHPESN